MEKQVRTLQKLAFHKEAAAAPAQTDPGSPPKLARRFGSRPDMNAPNISSAGTQTPMDDDVGNKRQCTILENRIAELENELAKADSLAREKVEEFQDRLKALTVGYLII